NDAGEDGASRAAKELTFESPLESHARSVWTFSSDSELSPENSPIKEDQKISEQISEAKDGIHIGSNEDTPSKKASKDKAPRKELEEDDHEPIKEKKKSSVKRKGNAGDEEVTAEEAVEKQVGSHVSSARMPLVLSEKVQRAKALVECEGASIDLGGDVGAVGRIMVSNTSSTDHEMYLDLKGTIYRTTIVPSRTFCVVSFGQSEAKIEAIMNDFIQLRPQSNVFEAETMVEGTLDGFSFDSDEEAEKFPKGVSHQTGQNEEDEEKANGKTRGKAEKKSGVSRKRGKTTGGKSQSQKKVKKKAPVSKKAKTKK
ncbi:DNA-binding protein BIN4, partial [Morus notabilis]|uniref:DNA-binding protein BIN4 n=1 Tax=Morus notabilis TaxID=981085 RepID=UPI000CED1774